MTYIIPYFRINTSGNMEDKLVIWLFSILIYLSGYLYEGIKNKNWSLSILNLDNLAKFFGGVAFIVESLLIIFTISKLSEIL